MRLIFSIHIFGLWVEIWLLYGKKINAKWTEELIRKMDKFHNLKGVEMMVCRLGNFVFEDHLPADMHFKPLLKQVMLCMFEKTACPVKILSTGELRMDPIYALTGKEGNRYTTITHVSSGQTVQIPQDYTVTDSADWKIVNGHSWTTATLKGTRANENIYQLFVEAEKNALIEYDTDTFLLLLLLASSSCLFLLRGSPFSIFITGFAV